MRLTFTLKLLFIVPFLIFISCSSSKNIEDMNVDELYTEAVRLFKDDDLLEAAKIFDIIKLQYPASQYADDAQYYVAEINFEQKEFIMAAYNYNLLRRAYPASPYYQESYYKTALSYYKLSPSSQRDQDYTKKALKAFQEFQYLYPSDSLYDKASIYIDELRSKLAEREYEIAQLYRTLEYPKSAIIYFDTIINEYDDTKFYEDAYAGKIEVLYKIGNYDEAMGLIDLYEKRFPDGDNKEDVQQIKRSIQALKASN